MLQEQRKKFNVKKANVKRCGQPFNLSFDEVVWPSECPIFGMALDYFSESRSDRSVSITRKNSEKEWSKENLLICSWKATKIKNISSLEDLYKVVDFCNKNVL